MKGRARSPVIPMAMPAGGDDRIIGMICDDTADIDGETDRVSQVEYVNRG